MIESWQHLHSTADILGKPFIAHTYRFQGVATAVATTLIEYASANSASKAILYLHGYTDYFFQDGLAQHFDALGLRFFALDLQGYGRSIRPNSSPNWCESLEQYHDDLHIALSEIHRRGITEVTLLAHSTGGLIASHYLATHSEKKPDLDAMPEITGLILNSPFLALPFAPKVAQYVRWPIWATVCLLPFHSLRTSKISTYAKTLHQTFHGEWAYRLDWKPARGFPLSFNWLKQVMAAQQTLQQTALTVPTLLCHASRSTRHAQAIEDIQKGDGVLDIESMTLAAKNIFTTLSLQAIEGGYHDLFLSPAPVRQHYLTTLDRWLLENGVISASIQAANCHSSS